MKKGEDPQRGKKSHLPTAARVFVITYLPNLQGFFSEMRTILQLCLNSLERTLDPEIARVALVDNGSCREIENLLMDRRSPLFDQVLLNKENRGKIDGLLSAARGALEDVVVLSDCDVLFQKGWLEEVLRVFSNFPEAPSVSPIASPRRYSYETRTTLLDSALKRELCVKARMPLEDFVRMTEGSTDPDAQMKFFFGQATVSRNGYETGLAGGHQCVAFRREMLLQLPEEPCLALLEPHADRDYLDRPPDVLGYWRLSTPRNMAFHMGNTPSGWMFDIHSEQVSHDPPKLPLPRLRKPAVARIPYFVRRKLAYFVYSMLTKKLARNGRDQRLNLNNETKA